MSDTPRLVSIVNLFPSTSETFVERKARALIAAGFDVTMAAGRLATQDPGAPPVPTLRLPDGRRPRTWVDAVGPLVTDADARARTAPALRSLRRDHWLLPVIAGGFDIVHFEFSGIAASAVDALPLLRPARLSVSCRGAAEQITPHRDPARADRLARVFAEVDLIHCVSADMARTIEAFDAPAHKVVVNRPAVDTAGWQGVGRVAPGTRGTAEDPLRVVSVARLHWKKAFDDAIRAVAMARDAGVHVRYRIAGDGPEREKLLYLRHDLGLEDEVELLGWQDQDRVRGHLGWGDAFWLPSLSEGISNSALEAMAAGLPIVSTRCGGMEEVLTAPDAGILVDVGDLRAMADALATLTDHDRRRHLAEGARRAVEVDFDLSRQARVFAEAYRSLL